MQLGYFAKVITSGRNINDAVHTQIGKEIVQYLIEQDKSLKRMKVLVMGVTFKENVSDIRNSKVPELIKELLEFSINIDVIDPFADPKEFHDEYGIKLTNGPSEIYDAVVMAVNHSQYQQLDEAYFKELMGGQGMIYDVKGVYRGKIKDLKYLSL